MSISAGTYTFGASGVYASLGAAVLDLAATLTGDIVFVQVGNSSNSGAQILNATDRNGHNITVSGGVAHQGSFLNGYVCTVGDFRWQWTGIGTTLFDDVYIRIDSKYSGVNAFVQFGFGSAQWAFMKNQFRNCLFRCDITSASNLGFQFAASPINGAGTSTLEFANCKFYTLGNTPPCFLNSSFTTGAQMFRVFYTVENCAVYWNNPAAAQFAFWNYAIMLSANTGAGFPLGGWHVTNTVVWNSINTRNGIYSDPANGAPLTVSKNARNQSADALTWAYTGITTPTDIVNLDPTLPNFLDTAIASPLFSAGAAPALSINPYVTPPYPIGVYYATPPPPAVPGRIWMPAFAGGL